jgi:putative transposase
MTALSLKLRPSPDFDALAMVFKLVEGAQKTWRRLDGHNQKFTDGCEVIAKPGYLQSQIAAA